MQNSGLKSGNANGDQNMGLVKASPPRTEGKIFFFFPWPGIANSGFNARAGAAAARESGFINAWLARFSPTPSMFQ